MSDGTPGMRSIDAHRPYLLRYARMLARDPALAEDAVQDTMIAAHTQFKNFDGRSHLRTWLTTILKRKVIDLARKRDREAPKDAVSLDDESLEAAGEFNFQGRWNSPPAEWGNPDEALESRQFWQVFEGCCLTMPERQARVFVMREVFGMSTEEICKELGISVSNLHVLIFRARLSLQASLTKDWFGSDHP